jgi:hypothetical protein
LMIGQTGQRVSSRSRVMAWMVEYGMDVYDFADVSLNNCSHNR